MKPWTYVGERSDIEITVDSLLRAANAVLDELHEECRFDEHGGPDWSDAAKDLSSAVWALQELLGRNK